MWHTTSLCSTALKIKIGNLKLSTNEQPQCPIFQGSSVILLYLHVCIYEKYQRGGIHISDSCLQIIKPPLCYQEQVLHVCVIFWSHACIHPRSHCYCRFRIPFHALIRCYTDGNRKATAMSPPVPVARKIYSALRESQLRRRPEPNSYQRWVKSSKYRWV